MIKNIFVITVFFAVGWIPWWPAELSAQSAPDTTYSARGLVKAQTRTVIAAQIDGVIEKVFFEPGEKFRKSDLLIKFKCNEYELAFERASAALERATINKNNKLDLIKTKSISNLELAIAIADEKVAQADMRMAKLPVEYCDIRSPFAGLLVNKLVDAHQFVRAGDNLLEILDSQNYEIYLILPSSWITWLQMGSEFEVIIDETGNSYSAQMVRQGATVDPASQTITVIARFLHNPKDILAGMTGTASFTINN